MRRRSAGLPPTRSDGEAYFWTLVEKTDGCWNWLGATAIGGYGRMISAPAYRYAYELLVGPIPDGMWIDHKCHNPQCVNPDHLRPVTPKQNGENLPGARSNSKSGVRGVYWAADRQRWRVEVGHNYRTYKGGSFLNLEEADRGQEVA